jgi:hypothetical protein
MPNILFASNNISHFPTAVSSNVVGTFDPTRVPYSIAAYKFETLNSPSFIPTTGDVTWFHFRTYFKYIDYNAVRTLLRATDSAGNLIFEIRKLKDTYESFCTIKVYNGVSPITVTTNLPLTFEKMNFIDVKVTVGSLKVEAAMYVNGQLAGVATLASNPNNFGAPSRFSIGTAFTSDMDNYQHYSEIIVADDDTRNARLNLLRPDAAGNYDDWQGQLSVLSDDDTTTGMTTIAPDKFQTVGLTDYTGASNISNVVSISSTTRGRNSPTKIEHIVRLSGVDYFSQTHPVPYELAYQISDYKINPATTLPWTASDVAAIEAGFVSRA